MRYRAGRRIWTAAEDRILRERYPHEPTAMIAKNLRRSLTATYARADKLGLEKTDAYRASPQAYRFRRGYHKGWEHRFKKGQTPANKGLRRPGWHRGRMQETQFKKGVRQGVAVMLYKPVGTERLSKDGYLERKVRDYVPPPGVTKEEASRQRQRVWRGVHLLVWEAAHGPIPNGYAVVFINGDKTDIREENLQLITRGDLMRRNSVHHLPAPLKSTIHLLGQLKRRIRERTEDAASN